MEPLRLSEVAGAVGVELRGADAVATGVSLDTRSIRPGELFFAIKGRSFDGHSFVRQAVESGAAGAVVSDSDALPGNCAAIVVPDTRAALLQAAAAYRTRFKVRVAGVTGSNGKTTTKEMLATILSSRFRTVRAEGSYNNDIGVPLTLFRLDRQTEAAVFEVEMNEPGGTLRLARAFRPEVGVITNIGDTHLEMMHDRAGVAAEKAELLRALPRGGAAVLNGDDPLVMETGNRHWSGRRVAFGLGQADVFATDVEELGLEGVRFRLQGRYVVSLALPGRHNVANCLAACAAASVLGIEFERMPEALEDFRPPAMRLRVLRLGRVTLIEDCYNANPQSMAAALEILGKAGTPGARVAVLADMLELGPRSAELHRELGRAAAAAADRLVVVGAEAEHVARGARDAGLGPEHIRCYPAASAAADALFDIITPQDTILVKGSRAMGLESISQRIKSRYEEDAGKVH